MRLIKPKGKLAVGTTGTTSMIDPDPADLLIGVAFDQGPTLWVLRSYLVETRNGGLHG